MFRSISNACVDTDDAVLEGPQPSQRAGTSLLRASPEDLDFPEPEIDCAEDSTGLPKRSWLLTIFTGDKEGLFSLFQRKEEETKFCVIGKETCPTTGRLHCHVAICMRSPVRLAYWRKLIDPTGHKWNAKWCKDSLFERFIRYCQKEDKASLEFGQYQSKRSANRDKASDRKLKLEEYRILASEGKCDQIPESEYRSHYKYYDGIAKKAKYERIHENYREYVESEWASRNYKSWQRDLLKEVESPPDNRSILWVYDSQGGAGKSSFARHLELKFDCQVLIPAKSADVAFALDPGKFLYILDIPRTMGEHVPWGFLESLKNGLYLNPKYESRFVHMRPPHIIVMCNAPPPDVTEKMGFSEDRIKLITI